MAEVKEDKLEKKKKLAQILKKLNSKSTTPIANFDEDIADQLKIDKVSCNVPSLNKALNGGFARGCIHLLAGRPGSGKTSLALSLVKAHQDKGEQVVYVCTELPFPEERARSMGVDVDNLVMVIPTDTGDQLVDSIYSMLYDVKDRKPTGLVGAIVWDSLNNTIAKKAIDKIEKDGSAAPGMAERALLITKFLENLQGRGMLRKTADSPGVSVYLITQLRSNMSGYGDAEQISGGWAAQFNAKTILLFKHSVKGKTISGVHTLTHQDISATIKKNGIDGFPCQVMYRYDFKDGLDDVKGLIEQALGLGFIFKEGKSTYVIKQYQSDDIRHDMKKDEIHPFLKENSEYKESLMRYILAQNGELDESGDIIEPDEDVFASEE